MNVALAIATASAAAWLYLLALRGGFWLGRERDDRLTPEAPSHWPSVTAIVPARNEADVVAAAISSLKRQEYPGVFRILLIDDGSTDGTVEAARSALGGHPLEIVAASPVAGGWTGKLWAQNQGVEVARGSLPKYYLFTDADISHVGDNLKRLVSRAEDRGLALTSLMARLTVRSGWERLLIPAFILFFQMLFPFSWVNDPKRRTAAAAGGCMLVNRERLEAAGGLAAIRGHIIDDCALARLLKQRGPIWLGLTRRLQSLRPYGRFAEIARMVSRSAYAQLGFSPWLMVGTVLGMLLVFAAPPALFLVAAGPAKWLGLATWTVMVVVMYPTLRLYRLWGLWGLALPLAGALYSAFTLWSAIEQWRGRGGQWKGRIQAGGMAPAGL